SLCAKPEGCTSPGSLTTIKAGLSALNDITVAGADAYFGGNEGDYAIVYKCPVAGCPAAGPTIVESGVNDDPGRIVAGPSDVLWTRFNYYGPYSRKCSLPACSANVGVRPYPPAVGSGYGSDNNRELVVPSKIVSVGLASTLWATGSTYSSNQYQL